MNITRIFVPVLGYLTNVMYSTYADNLQYLISYIMLHMLFVLGKRGTLMMLYVKI